MDKLSDTIAKRTAKEIDVKLITLSYKHFAANIGRKKVGPAFVRDYQDQVGELDEVEVPPCSPLFLLVACCTASRIRRLPVAPLVCGIILVLLGLARVRLTHLPSASAQPSVQPLKESLQL
ncbi:hypothetical protein K461DRAFT_314821 [Myriangium duriaei CBS 260.36]|uniref:Uncharacterized protein n=1 Tax=Myriangium duriaei CBS 260.36 TaxID=1168546 RepID=A0A9P4IXL0_9PEZI|nr:hypothetical protein K461DRAFT_314821 [Myriangium duriaei CBS 260.36]